MTADIAAGRPESAVVGCWVSPGWSAALTVEGHEDWPDVSRGEGSFHYVAHVAAAASW